MKNKKQKGLSVLIVIATIVTMMPLSFVGAVAELISLSSNELSIQSTVYPVRFYHRNRAGEQVLYEQSGFANPQMVNEGELPALPPGQPDEYAGHRFVGWDENATNPVYGSTHVYAMYEALSTVTYTVEFVREDGVFVGESFHAIVKEGEPIVHTLSAPALEGYHPTEELPMDGFSFAPSGSNGTVSIHVAQATGDRVYRIIYTANPETTYYVDHYTQELTGGYALDSSEPMTGPTGSLARPQGKEIEGFTLSTDLSAIAERIEAGGNTRIRLEYARNEHSVYFDPGVLGRFETAQENPVLVKYGAPLPTAKTPVRSGYDFDQWEYDEAYTAMPDRDILATAKWTPGQADCQVVVWGQRADKNPLTRAYDEYAVLDTFTATGVTGTAATFDVSNKTYQHFTYDRNEQDVMIEGDGSSVLNVYFSRDSYTISFYRYNGYTPMLTITGKYHENIRDRYSQSFLSTYGSTVWMDGSYTLRNLPTVIPEENRSYTEDTTGGRYKYVLNKYFQNILPNGSLNTSMYTYPLHSTRTRYQDYKGGNYVVYYDQETGYELLSPSISWDANGQGSFAKPDPVGKPATSTANMYFNLRHYDITYNDRGRSYKQGQYYTGSLNGYGSPSEFNAVVPGYEDYTFEGWYIAQDYSGSPYSFDGRTMPAENLIVFAKWTPPTYTVTFETGHGTPVPAQSVSKGAYAAEPAAPTFDQHSFEGWYRDAQYRSRFLFSQPITGDMTLHAKWSGDNTVRVTKDGIDVTANYLLSDATSYHPGTLKILPGGSETPVVIRARDQHYVYNEKAQGIVGDVSIAATDPDPVATAEGLLQGHRLSQVHIGGSQQTEPAEYPDTLVPSQAVIVDGNGIEVTGNYTFTADSYVAGDLTIHKKGNGKPDGNGGEEPMEVTAADQTYVYNGKPQGQYGTLLTVEAKDPLATAVALIDGHRLHKVSLKGEEKTNHGEYPDEIMPTGVQILNAGGVDVTEKYLLTAQSYIAGDLTIHKKGNGTPDGNGGEEPMDITAADQTYVYTGSPQGEVGIDLPVTETDPLATAVQLAPDHALASISIAGNRETAPDTYPNTLIPGDAKIVDKHNNDVTENYRIEATSYHPGTLKIQPGGSETPIVIRARDQHYVYNEKAQGIVGHVDITQNDPAALAVAEGLLQGHRLKSVTIDASPQIEPGEYFGTLIPEDAVIVDAQGADVTSHYVFGTNSYVAGDLIIHKKGNGKPDGKGGEEPMEVTVFDQAYIYNGKPQGTYGTMLPINASDPLAEAIELVPGHRLANVTITGTPQTNHGTYDDALIPTQVRIINANKVDVTSKYLLTAESYIAGTLTIRKKGNGDPDGNGGELPMDITATDQIYHYTGDLQGEFGTDLPVLASRPLATAKALVNGHVLKTIDISGTPERDADTYPDRIVPGNARIADEGGVDVTDNYLIVDATSYHPGMLKILPGGSETPVVIRARDQHYVYNETPQGIVGNLTIAENDPNAAVTAEGLLQGHRLASVYLGGAQMTDPGDYLGTLVPRDAVIRDAGGKDVTDNYTFGAGSYVAGDLIIHKKGNGIPDGNGGEEPMEVTAADQHFVYNEKPQGTFGTLMEVDENDPIASAVDLVKGHTLTRVSLQGAQQTDPGRYADAVEPTGIQILNANKQDVTDKYLLTADSYISGTLTIHKKGNGNEDGNGGEEPMDITAADQVYIYNGTPQGEIGETLAVRAADPVAIAVQLIEGHTLKQIAIRGQQQTEAKAYPDALMPAQARIVDRNGRDVTDKYLIVAESYHPGSLIINKKGNGVPDGNGGEEPMVITAGDQHFVYNEKPQGTYGASLPVDAAEPIATAQALVKGHVLGRITLTGDQQTLPETYPGAIKPSAAQIMDAFGREVTENYLIVDASYVAGNLIIHKKGNGNETEEGGEDPLDVTATDQSYVYNGKPQGIVGESLRVSEDQPLASAIGLVPGHRLATVSIQGSQRTVPSVYQDALLPTKVRIVDELGRDVTGKYRIEDTGFHPGDLTIFKKGNGEDDGKGGEEPMVITAVDQAYIYNGQPQGIVGEKLAVGTENPLASATDLIPGHKLTTITISGSKQKDVGIYPDSLTPKDARIADETGRDVTDNYLIETSSYAPGNLTIRKNDEVYILSIHHVDTEGKVINVPTISIHLAGDKYGYASLAIRDYRAIRASIQHDGKVVEQNAATSGSNLVMPAANVTVIITYQSTGTEPTPTPTPTPTPSPGSNATTPPSGGGGTGTGGGSRPSGGGSGSTGSGSAGTGITDGAGASGATGSGTRLTTITDEETPLQGYTNKTFGDCVE